MSTILDGRKVRDSLAENLSKRIRALSIAPQLAIIQVGDRPDSTAFIAAKKAFAKKIGIKEKHIQISEDASEEEIIEKVQQCNNDDSIHGIIVQLHCLRM